MKNRDEDLSSMFSAEFSFLLACIRVYLNLGSIEELKVLKQNVSNWGHFIHLAKSHKVIFVIHEFIKDYRDFLPEKVQQNIKLIHRRNVAHMMQLSRELIHFNILFTKNYLSPIPLKGPLLAEQLYGNHSNSRKSVDLDILVEPKDFAKAEAILFNDGYQLHPEIKIKEKNIKKYKQLKKKTSYHLAYHSPKTGILVELHWKLSKFNPKDYKPDTTSIQLNNEEFTILSEDEQIIFLANHGLGHLWDKLLWLIDLHKLTTNADKTDKIIDKAKAKNAEKGVLSGLLLSHYLFKKPLSKKQKEEIKKDKNLDKLRFYCLEFLKASDIKHKRSKYKEGYLHKTKVKAHYLMQGSLKQKADFVTSRFVNLTHWRILPLPSNLHFLYILLFPFLFAYSSIKRIFS